MEYAGTVLRGEEAVHVVLTLGHDDVIVPGPVLLDVVHSLVEAAHNLDGPGLVAVLQAQLLGLQQKQIVLVCNYIHMTLYATL